MVLTTFNKELYEQGLKEDAVREANEKIASLELQAQQLNIEIESLQNNNQVLQQENESLLQQLKDAETKLKQFTRE